VQFLKGAAHEEKAASHSGACCASNGRFVVKGD